MQAATVVDLHEARHAKLVGAVREARERIAALVQSAPAELNDLERVQWGFALGEAHRRLGDALDVDSPSEAVSGVHAYREARLALVRFTWWARMQCEQRQNELASVRALETVTVLLASLLSDASTGEHTSR